MARKKSFQINSRLGLYIAVGGVLLVIVLVLAQFVNVYISTTALGPITRATIRQGGQAAIALTPQAQARKLEICIDSNNRDDTCQTLVAAVDAKQTSAVITVPVSFPLGRAVIIGRLRGEDGNLLPQQISDNLPLLVVSAKNAL